MKYDTVKARYVEQQISSIIGASELPISTMYYIMKSLTSDIESLMIQQVQKEKAELDNDPEFDTPVEETKEVTE